MNKKRISIKNEKILRPWVILAGLVIGMILLSITCLSVVLFSNQSPTPENPTAVVRYIPAPTVTQTLVSQNIENQSTATSLPPGENLTIGSNIRIEGTGGSGLRLRSAAGLSGQIKHLIHDGEEMIIDDGPNEIDGYIWWHVKSSTDATISGWGVADYMVNISKP